jgi:hypothetical protein
MSEQRITGWASTKPGHNRYHFYDEQGKSLCSYQRKPGPLHFADDPKQLSAEDCCSSCDLHILKAKHPERYNSHPTLPVARQSSWQQKQYGAPPPPAASSAPPPAGDQLKLF